MTSTKPPPSVAQRLQSGRDLYARRCGSPLTAGTQCGQALYQARHGAPHARTSGLSPALTAVESEPLGLGWEAEPAHADTTTMTKEGS